MYYFLDIFLFVYFKILNFADMKDLIIREIVKTAIEEMRQESSILKPENDQ